MHLVYVIRCNQVPQFVSLGTSIQAESKKGELAWAHYEKIKVQLEEDYYTYQTQYQWDIWTTEAGV
jgi:hypothetical protein